MINHVIGCNTPNDFMQASSLAGQKYPLSLRITNLQTSPLSARGVVMKGIGCDGSSGVVTFDSVTTLAAFIGAVVSIARLHKTVRAVELKSGDASPLPVEGVADASASDPQVVPELPEGSVEQAASAASKSTSAGRKKRSDV